MNNFNLDESEPISREEEFAIAVFSILMIITMNGIIAMYSCITTFGILSFIKKRWKQKQ